MLKDFVRRGWFHFALLLVWIAIGTGLRFTNLAAKSPWSDEFATLVFSLGNSFLTVPLDQAIALDTLLQPLQPRPEIALHAVFHNLMTESTHPPVYFMLNHLWMQLFPTEGGLASLWAARAFSAILGVVSIPAIFGLGWLAFRSRLVGHLAAAMMAVSPYGIYQAQEPRHYTLAILLIIASLSCLVLAMRHIYQKTPLPVWLVLIWITTNALGIAIHYFFTLTICAEAIVLLVLAWRRSQETEVGSRKSEVGSRAFGSRKSGDLLSASPPLSELSPSPLIPHPSPLTPYPFAWWRIFAVAVGTLAGGLVWLPFWQSIPGNQLTDWIYNGNPFENGLETIARFLAWIITMLWLLPVEGVSQPIVLTCGAIVVIFVLWTLPILIKSWRLLLGRSLTSLATQVLGGFVLAALALFFGITYTLDADLSIASRYHFVYFPAFIVVIGAALAICWDASHLAARADLGWTTRQQSLLHFLKTRGKKAVVLIWLLGFLGGLTVVSNLGYQKIERADILVPIIHQRSQHPVLIATAHKTHGQTREMIALGWEFKRLYRSGEPVTNPPLFLLAHQEPNSNSSVTTLKNTLTQLPRPLDLWIVNFPRAKGELDRAERDEQMQNCTVYSRPRPEVNGYKYKLYHCR